MTVDILLQIFLPILFGLAAISASLIGWIGNRINNRLEEIGKTLASIDADLRDQQMSLDRRITRLEAQLLLVPKDFEKIES